jgi:hypothetical protein
MQGRKRQVKAKSNKHIINAKVIDSALNVTHIIVYVLDKQRDVRNSFEISQIQIGNLTKSIRLKSEV